MASGPKRNRIAKLRNVIAERAAMVLDRGYAGPHRDKRIARDFGVSVRMAQHLRAGQHWTLDRLAQASAIIGAAFDMALVSGAHRPESIEIGEFVQRLAELEAWRAEVVRGGDGKMAPGASISPVAAGERDGLGPAPGIGGGGAEAHGGGRAAPGEGGELARTIRVVGGVKGKGNA